MLESSSVFKMNSKAALEKTIVLLTSLIQIKLFSSDSQCSQIDNSFMNKPQVCKPEATVARNQNSVMNQNVAFGSFHWNGWTSDIICCSIALSKQLVVTSELNWTQHLLEIFYARFQHQLLAPGLQLLAYMSHCCALFSSGLSVYHCVSGSKVWICHCISMPRFKHTHTIILPQSKLSIYIKYIRKRFYWIFIVLLCFCYLFLFASC